MSIERKDPLKEGFVGVMLTAAFGDGLTERDKRIILAYQEGRIRSFGDKLKVGLVLVKYAGLALRPGVVARRVESVLSPLDDRERAFIRLRTGATRNGVSYTREELADKTNMDLRDIRMLELRAYQKLPREN